MKSDFERKKFWTQMFIITAICGALLLIVGYALLELSIYKLFIVLLIFIIFAVILSLLFYRQYNKMLLEIEDISDIMTKVINEEITSEREYLEEGSLGILYSNFYKMVNAFQDSKRREINEKVFLRDIISDISHQLKTPLASLNIFVDLLIDDKLDADKRKQILLEASKQLDRMEWMVLSMLKLARIEAKSIIFEKATCSLKLCLKDAVEGIRNLLKEKHQTVNIKIDEDIDIVVDRAWFTEALINLLKNASDYSMEGKSISIEAEKTNIYSRIYIKDEGVGISEEDIPHIFERFYRAKQNVNPNSVGIGLALTKSIIEGMGAEIKVRSKLGEYTTFIITIMK